MRYYTKETIKKNTRKLYDGEYVIVDGFLLPSKLFKGCYKPKTQWDKSLFRVPGLIQGKVKGLPLETRVLEESNNLVTVEIRIERFKMVLRQIKKAEEYCEEWEHPELEREETRFLDLGGMIEGRDYRKKGDFYFLHHEIFDNIHSTHNSKKRYGSKWIKLERGSFQLAA